MGKVNRGGGCRPPALMIARRSVLIYATNAVGALLGYVGIVAVARFVPNSEEFFGLVGFGIGFVGGFFVLAGLGIPQAHVKRVSEGEPLEACLGTFALLRLVQTALAVGATLLAVYVWTVLLGRGFETPLHFQVIFVMLVYYLALNLGGFGTATFDARLETAKSQTSDFVGTVIRVTGMVVVGVVGLGALALAWAYALGALASAAVAAILLLRYPMARPRLALLRSYVKFAFPLALPAVLGGLSATVDKVVIQLFWGAAQVGYYFVSQRVLLLVGVASAAVSLLLFPSLSQLHAQNDVGALRRKAAQAERYLSMVVAPVAAFLVAYPEGVIHVLFSDDFLPATNVLRLFGLVTFVGALLTPRQAVLQGMDRSDLAGTVALASALVTLVLYFVLVPASFLGLALVGWAAQGAAAAVLVGYSVALGLAVAFTHRLTGDRLRRPVFVHVLAAAFLVVLFALLLPPGAGLEWRWFHLLGVYAAFLGAYLLLLAVVREFRRDDFLLFLDVVNPKKMVRYVREELTEGKVE